MNIKITTNNQPRHILYWDELTPEEQSEHDWISVPEDGHETFFRYRGWCHCLSDFVSIQSKESTNEFHGWDAASADTVWSGVLVRLSEGNERVTVGRYVQLSN